MNLASYIDHTMLKPQTVKEDVKRLCREALDKNFAAVCINPSFVPLASSLLKGSSVLCCTVVGFPLGATLTQSKIAEASHALDAGAQEVDMVMNIGAALDADWKLVGNEIRQLAALCHEKGAELKVILETSLLSRCQIVHACELAVQAGTDFVKTSSGFAGGAEVDVVRLMAETVNGQARVKASGGIRSREQAEAMIAAGAHRLGTSSGLEIVSN